MNPNILGVKGPGFLNQVPTLGRVWEVNVGAVIIRIGFWEVPFYYSIQTLFYQG